MPHRIVLPAVLSLSLGCIPPGNATPDDAGAPVVKPNVASAPTFHPSVGVMVAPFFDDFNRPGTETLTAKRSPPPVARPAAGEGGAVTLEGGADAADKLEGPKPGDPGPDWRQAQTDVWHIESGKLCGQGAQNHGVWLNRVLPVNAKIEYDAISDSPDGDLKSEIWGDGQSHATAMSYTNATSYLAILGGWKNTLHVLARINEHGNDRKEIAIDKSSDDPREQPVIAGQPYHVTIERSDGKTVRFSVNGQLYLSWEDKEPLAGAGHDHFGFNDWNVKVCFDNVRVTPLTPL